MLNKKEIQNRIKTIGTNSSKLRGQVQDVLIQIAGHAYEHGDVTQYDALFAATSGMNRKRIAAWIRDNGFAKLTNKGTFEVNKTARKRADFSNGADVVEYLTEYAPLWYADEETAPQVAQELNVASRVKSLAAQIDKAASGGRKVKIDYKEAREALETLQASIARQSGAVEVDFEPAH